MHRRRQSRATPLALAGLLSACAYIRPTTPQATVLFDEAHGQRFLVGQQGTLDLSRLGGVLEDQGLVVKPSRQQISDSTFSGVEALVISGPFAPLTPAEIESILRFLRGGGRLCVMLHIRKRVTNSGPADKPVWHSV